MLVNDNEYKRVPEIKNGSCLGCVFDNEIGEPFPLECDEVRSGCINSSLIYKKIIKKETKMRNSKAIILSTVNEILLHKLLDQCKDGHIYTFSGVENEIDNALCAIEDSDLEEFITDNLDISEEQKDRYAETKLKETVNQFIVDISNDNTYDIRDIYNNIKEEAILLLKSDLLDKVIDDNIVELNDLYLNEFYDKLETVFVDPLVNLVRNAIEKVDNEKIVNMVKESIEVEVEAFIEMI